MTAPVIQMRKYLLRGCPYIYCIERPILFRAGSKLIPVATD